MSGARGRLFPPPAAQKKLDFGKKYVLKYWTYAQHEEKYADFCSPRRLFPSDCF